MSAIIFDSPETIANKYKEFSTAISGYSKTEVKEALLHNSKQIELLFAILKTHNIDLNIEGDDEVDAAFNRPISDEVSHLSKFATFVESPDLATLKDENDKLKSRIFELENLPTDSKKSSSTILTLESELAERDKKIQELLKEKNETQQNTENEIVINVQEDLETMNSQNNITELEETIELLKYDVEEGVSKLKILHNQTVSDKETIDKLVAEKNELIATLEANITTPENICDTKINSSTETSNGQVELLEEEIIKIERDKQELQIKLSKKEEALQELSKIDIEAINKKEQLLSDKEREIRTAQANIESVQKELAAKEQEISRQESDILKKLALIEKNKDLVSENYLIEMENKKAEVESKDKRITNLQTQMQKILLSAEENAEKTEADARTEANEITKKANETAVGIISEAQTTADRVLRESQQKLDDLQNATNIASKELDEIKTLTYKESEAILTKANKEAEEILTIAKDEIVAIKVKAQKEADMIKKSAEREIELLKIDAEEIQGKIDDSKKYHLAVKNKITAEVRQFQSLIENFLYKDALERQNDSEGL